MMAVQSSNTITKRDIFFVIFGMVTLILDWGSDCRTAFEHYKNKDYMWFGLTVSFMILASLVTMGVSLYWFHNDRKSPQNANMSRCMRRAHFVLILLQLSPLVRYGNTLWCGYKSRRHRKLRNKEGEDERMHEKKQKYYYRRTLSEGIDSVLLRMLECFFEAAPQLILQLYIVGQANNSEKYNTFWYSWMVTTSLISLGSLAWGVTGHTRSARSTNNDEENISISQSAAISISQFVILLFWHIFLLAARATAMVVFALVFQLWLVGVCVVHWLLMSSVLMFRSFNKTDDSSHDTTRLWEITESCLMGIFYIFVFLNNKDKPTRKKYIAYYTLWEVENVAMLVACLWYDDQIRVSVPHAFIFHVSAFFLGIIFMLTYYRCLHPRIIQPHHSSNSTPLQKEHNIKMVALEDRTGVDLEDRTGVALEDRTGVDLEDRTGVDLEDRTGVDLEDRTGVDLEDGAGVDLEDRTGVDLEDRTGVDLEARGVLPSRFKYFIVSK